MKIRTCGSCFRYVEDWRDAKAKGMEPRYTRHLEYSHKPREGVKPRCMCGGVKEGIHEKHAPCKHHQFRWTWNLENWWKWHFRQKLSNWYRVNVRVPIGSKRKPVPLKYRDYFDGMRDRIIPGGEPECPRCGEMPYSYSQCVFCGQRFIEPKGESEQVVEEMKSICKTCSFKDNFGSEDFMDCEEGCDHPEGSKLIHEAMKATEKEE